MEDRTKMSVKQSNDYVSLGQLAADLQQTPGRIERVCARLGVKPAMRLNRVCHYDAAQAETITALFRTGKESKDR